MPCACPLTRNPSCSEAAEATDPASVKTQPTASNGTSAEQFRTASSFSLPRRYVLIHRVLSASVGILCQLGATAPYREIVERWMPEIFLDD